MSRLERQRRRGVGRHRRDEVDDAGREADLAQHLGEHDDRERVLRRRLHHHRAADRERGRDLAHHVGEREVVRGDARHRADGLAVDVRAHEPAGRERRGLHRLGRHGDADALRRVARVAVEALERDRHLHPRADGRGGTGLGDDQRHEVGAELARGASPPPSAARRAPRPASPTTPGTPPARPGRPPRPAPPTPRAPRPRPPRSPGSRSARCRPRRRRARPRSGASTRAAASRPSLSPVVWSCEPGRVRAGQGYNLTLRQTFSAAVQQPEIGGPQCSTRSSRARPWSTAPGHPASSPTSGIADGRIVAIGAVDERRHRRHRRRRPGARARVRRPAHALRRAAPVGPHREPVERARRHHRRRRQLRVHRSRRCTTATPTTCAG